MRWSIVLVALLLPHVALAVPKVMVVGPAGDRTTMAPALRKRLPIAVAASCGLELVEPPVVKGRIITPTFPPADQPCDNLRCAFDAIASAKVDYVVEARLANDPLDRPALEVMLHGGRALESLGKGTILLTKSVDDVGNLAELLLGDLCRHRYAREGTGTRGDAPPLTQQQLEERAMQSHALLATCFDKLAIGTRFESRGQPPIAEWVVRADGTSTAVALTSPPQTAASSGAACIENEIATWTFPPRERAEMVRDFSLSQVAATPAPVVQDPTAAESLSKDDIIEGVRANGASIAPCVTRARLHKEVSPGRTQFVLSWAIRPDGTVASAALMGPPNVLGTSLPQCFAKVMTGWRFRPSAKGAPVSNFPMPITIR